MNGRNTLIEETAEAMESASLSETASDGHEVQSD
jgi:hypothetical protein